MGEVSTEQARTIKEAQDDDSKLTNSTWSNVEVVDSYKYVLSLCNFLYPQYTPSWRTFSPYQGLRFFSVKGYHRIHWRIFEEISVNEEGHTRTRLCMSSVQTHKPCESSTHFVLIQWEVTAGERGQHQLTCWRRMSPCQSESAHLVPNKQSFPAEPEVKTSVNIDTFKTFGDGANDWPFGLLPQWPYTESSCSNRAYRIVGKFGGDLNLAVWQSGLKPPN